ncbi:cytochrome c/FTR1 family iron permease [Oxalobacteraceae bacterium R-40]|uniref:Cytochrome c/FTR1 family iron permease n=1 Tax=Keguizhuia sedimenti TaxID=3064264 RepID=A0ABU1BTV3_9BURK|nr:cytochrome c/FTR1 family iron permease [Oxalobacteraceae bacterium R-40]
MKLPRFGIFRLILALCITSVLSSPCFAQDNATEGRVKQIWQMLDYIAVDYVGAVEKGTVISKDEYAEMVEFSQSVEKQMAELPETGGKKNLQEASIALRESIQNKSATETVASRARALAASLIGAYPIPVAPAATPDLKLGARIYQAQCASCHGAEGNAETPLATKLNPPPIAFSDAQRARERSVLSLYQTTTQGVQGTSMQSFSSLSEEERWAVAYFVSTLSYTESERTQGEKLWKSDPALKDEIDGISSLTQSSEASLSEEIGPAFARNLLAYLRSNPAVVETSQKDSIAVAQMKLKESLAALKNGDRSNAGKLAISAYLDGFEPVEPALAAKNHALFAQIEKSMGLYRSAVNEGSIEAAGNMEAQLQSLLTEAKSALNTDDADPVSTFLSALLILLREGLEALLIVIAMIAFLRKAERNDALPYVHAGWIGALAAGGITWAVATYLVDISGASREITEGFAAIFAAVVLLTVGVWMHQKSLAGRWQAYVKAKMTHALNKRSLAFLFILSFVTVYREVFETVLFYAALWNEKNGFYLLLGLGTGIVILAAIAVVMLRTTRRLPIARFFAVSSALVTVLAVVLIGKGTAALQEAGILNVTPVSMPRIDLLGIYPSQQTLVAQLIVLALIAIGFALNLRAQKTLPNNRA